jgi:hypothetical protein
MTAIRPARATAERIERSMRFLQCGQIKLAIGGFNLGRLVSSLYETLHTSECGPKPLLAVEAVDNVSQPHHAARA